MILKTAGKPVKGGLTAILFFDLIAEDHNSLSLTNTVIPNIDQTRYYGHLLKKHTICQSLYQQLKYSENFPAR